VDELWRLSARELLAGYRARDFTPVEVLDALAERIELVEPVVNAFTTLSLDRARDEAARSTDAYDEGEAAGALAGVPFGVKDLFDTEGVRTTYGSPLFADRMPQADAEAVARLRAAGAILVGKTSTHEFAWGITSVNPHFGAVRNPWAPERFSGGSSGGSGAALAAGEVPLALGSDTGGSIRVPSAFCGVVGLKPTWGRVSAAGAFPLARSLDHPGPMARTPADAALFLEVIAGVDPADAATQAVPLGDLRGELEAGLRGLRVALCEDLHVVPLGPDVAAAYRQTVGLLRDLGAELVEVAFPEAGLSYETFVTTQRAEALFTHTERGLFPAQRDAYGEDVLGRLDAATEVTLPEYLAAAAERQRIRAGFSRIFEQADLLLTPVSAGPPLPIGEETTVHLGHEIAFRELAMSYTVPQDLTGLPACAFRAGFDELGIPVGMQLTGPAWSEARVLRGVQALFAATPETQSRWPSVP
jgi:aspartyl-tRNA(Asn)/glutamyl-tRNA(Gln) amidotransferase subunit A